VHVAARIGAAARAGEILVSAETLEMAGGGFRAGERRSEPLKGVAEPVDVLAIDWR
jgi:class 3 adenylate cyclase